MTIIEKLQMISGLSLSVPVAIFCLIEMTKDALIHYGWMKAPRIPKRHVPRRKKAVRS